MKLVWSFLWLVRKILPTAHGPSFWTSKQKERIPSPMREKHGEAGRELHVIIRTFHIQTHFALTALPKAFRYYVRNRGLSPCFCFGSRFFTCSGPYSKILSFGLECHVPLVIPCCHSLWNAISSGVYWKVRLQHSPVLIQFRGLSKKEAPLSEPREILRKI